MNPEWNDLSVLPGQVRSYKVVITVIKKGLQAFLLSLFHLLILLRWHEDCSQSSRYNFPFTKPGRSYFRLIMQLKMRMNFLWRWARRPASSLDKVVASFFQHFKSRRGIHSIVALFSDTRLKYLITFLLYPAHEDNLSEFLQLIIRISCLFSHCLKFKIRKGIFFLLI